MLFNNHDQKSISDNYVKSMPNSTKRRPEMDFLCHFAYKNDHRSPEHF